MSKVNNFTFNKENINLFGVGGGWCWGGVRLVLVLGLGWGGGAVTYRQFLAARLPWTT